MLELLPPAPSAPAAVTAAEAVRASGLLLMEEMFLAAPSADVLALLKK